MTVLLTLIFVIINKCVSKIVDGKGIITGCHLVANVVF